MKAGMDGFVVLPLITAFIVCYVLTPVLVRYAMAWGMVDKPDARRIHKKITPRGGGIAVMAGFHVAGLLIFALRGVVPAFGESANWWLRMLPATLILGVTGVIDDRIGMRPIIKLILQMAAAAAAYAGGIHFGRMLGFEMPPVVDAVLTIGWFLGFINAFNLIDGLDGLASGLAIIASVGLAGAMWLRGAGTQIPLALALLGAALAFLRYNFYPARIFLGDTGSMFLGFALAGMAVTGNAKGTFMVSFVVPVLAIGVPVMDTLLAVWRRSIRRWNQSHVAEITAGQTQVFGADADHLHHRLLKEWKSQRAVAGYLYLLNALIAAAGLCAAVLQSYSTAIFISAVVTAAVVLFRHAAHIEIWDSGLAIVHGLMRPGRKRIASCFYPMADFGVLLVAFLTAEGLLRGAFWHGAFHEVGIDAVTWIGIPFIALAVCGAYRRVWSMARVSDLALVFFSLAAGILLAAAMYNVQRGAGIREISMLSLGMWSLALTGIVGIRVLPRMMQDVLPKLWHRGHDAAIHAPLRTLVYSASSSCTLFLRTLTQSGITEIKARHIVGLLDDDLNLHNRIVYGLPVFGGMNAVESVVGRHGINEIVIAQRLTPEQLGRLKSLAVGKGIRLLHWSAGLAFEPVELSLQTDHGIAVAA